jgi:hypothetical protein
MEKSSALRRASRIALSNELPRSAKERARWDRSWCVKAQPGAAEALRGRGFGLSESSKSFACCSDVMPMPVSETDSAKLARFHHPQARAVRGDLAREFFEVPR